MLWCMELSFIHIETILRVLQNGIKNYFKNDFKNDSKIFQKRQEKELKINQIYKKHFGSGKLDDF